MPGLNGLWERLAKLELDRNNRPNALVILLEGSKHFHEKSTRDKCVRLLRIAFKIKPWHFDTTIELSKQLARSREKGEAKKILYELSRRTQFAISPCPANLWLLVRALF